MDPYGELFDEYVTSLRQAREYAEAWWSELRAAAASSRSGARRGLRELSFRWPLGAVSHPRVLAVFREFYLRCDALNDKLREEDDARVVQEEARDIDESGWGVAEEPSQDTGIQEPRFVLIDRVRTVDIALWRFVNDLMFVPVGMDDRGRTV